MGNSTKKDSVIVVGEREFKRVKNGLDAAQVESFIDELIKERDKLAQSQDHIMSLTRLAEMTVVEADRLANQVKTESMEQAKAESTAIIDKAKEQARQMVEKRIAEAVDVANEKANAITAKAEEEAALLLENERNKIQVELRNLVNQQFGYMLQELESLKQQAEAVQADFGNRFSAPREDNSTTTVETVKKSNTIVAETAEEKDAAATKVTEESDTLAAEETGATAVEIAEESDTLATEESKAFDEQPAPSQADNHIEKGLDLSKLLEIEDQAELGKPQWEVEILPPFDIAKIMEVVSFLDQLPEVANTEMIVPQIDMPSILVFLRGSINFVDVLQTIPAVAHIEEVTTDKATANGEPGKRPRKVRISLSVNTTSPEKK
jgi:cell division septum initiation protein DivIVA